MNYLILQGIFSLHLESIKDVRTLDLSPNVSQSYHLENLSGSASGPSKGFL